MYTILRLNPWPQPRSSLLDLEPITPSQPCSAHSIVAGIKWGSAEPSDTALSSLENVGTAIRDLLAHPRTFPPFPILSCQVYFSYSPCTEWCFLLYFRSLSPHCCQIAFLPPPQRPRVSPLMAFCFSSFTGEQTNSHQNNKTFILIWTLSSFSLGLLYHLSPSLLSWECIQFPSVAEAFMGSCRLLSEHWLLFLSFIHSRWAFFRHPHPFICWKSLKLIRKNGLTIQLSLFPCLAENHCHCIVPLCAGDITEFCD